ncbi:IS3 family transposase [Streptomyces sp. NPDC057539]|uniref:IS3 family transposase n=1 Tax=Streptomyces sp. NPDC057539 TaxID=3346159 RepID=UPI0036754ECC
MLQRGYRRTYGVPRIHAEPRRLGRWMNRKRIARVMRERDIRSVTRRKHRSLTRPDTKVKSALAPQRPAAQEADARGGLPSRGKGVAVRTTPVSWQPYDPEVRTQKGASARTAPAPEP